MDCFVTPKEDPSTFPDRADTFLSDRSLGTLTGPRRFGRENLVIRVAEIARSKGLRVYLYPEEAVEDPDVILFDHWRDIDESLVASSPDADVLYGQDLCHQVPAIVRGSRSL